MHSNSRLDFSMPPIGRLAVVFVALSTVAVSCTSGADPVDEVEQLADAINGA